MQSLPCPQCFIAGVHRWIPHSRTRRLPDRAKHFFVCGACQYRWIRVVFCDGPSPLQKTFKLVYYLMVLKIGVRKRKEKERKRITAVYALSRVSPDLNADMLKKIICLAGLL